MEYIVVSFDMGERVLTLWWRVITSVLSCTAVMNICEAGAGFVL
jgi:hypothetical protein